MININRVIRRARSKHPAFDRFAHPDRTLRSEMDTQMRSLIQKATAVNPKWGAVSQEVALPLAPFVDGIAVDDHYRVTAVDYVPDGEAPRGALQTAFEDRITPRRFPTFYVLNQRVYLHGDEALWQEGDVVVWRVPVPAALDELTEGAYPEELDLPEELEPPLIAYLGDLMGRRAKVEEKLLRQFDQELKDAVETFVAIAGGAQ